jgi:hypothetical protein
MAASKISSGDNVRTELVLACSLMLGGASGLARGGRGIMQRYQVMIYDAKGEHLFRFGIEAPNKAVAEMMVLSQLCRNFATAPLVKRAILFLANFSLVPDMGTRL